MPDGAAPRASLSVEVRFLHVERRLVEQALGEDVFEPVDTLALPERVLVPWDEGIEERVELVVPVDALAGDGVVFPFSRDVRREIEPVCQDDRVVGRLVRTRRRVEGVVRVRSGEVPGPYACARLIVEVENTSDWEPPPGADRDTALAHSLISAHVLLGLDGGAFVSMTDPPEWAKGAVASCRNLHTWPVLAGESGRTDVVLSSPIILEDHPMVAPESPGALYDGTEIDEILALRTAALTDEEKREARGTDARAGAVIDLADSLPPEVWERLHGAVRTLRPDAEPAAMAVAAGLTPAPPDTPWWDPASDAGFDPARDRVVVEGRSLGAGSRVLLKPGPRRTDAQDLFLHGRAARVEAVLHDVDGLVHLAVTVDGDPGADLRREQGRFLYFQPDEITPLEEM